LDLVFYETEVTAEAMEHQIIHNRVIRMKNQEECECK